MLASQLTKRMRVNDDVSKRKQLQEVLMPLLGNEHDPGHQLGPSPGGNSTLRQACDLRHSVLVKNARRQLTT